MDEARDASAAASVRGPDAPRTRGRLATSLIAASAGLLAGVLAGWVGTYLVFLVLIFLPYIFLVGAAWVVLFAIVVAHSIVAALRRSPSRSAIATRLLSLLIATVTGGAGAFALLYFFGYFHAGPKDAAPSDLARAFDRMATLYFASGAFVGGIVGWAIAAAREPTARPA